MLDEKHVRNLVGRLGTAAARLLEDRHPDLITPPRDLPAAAGIAAILEALGAEVTALGAAAAVLVGNAEDEQSSASQAGAEPPTA
jgi:hypothetical protein